MAFKPYSSNDPLWAREKRRNYDDRFYGTEVFFMASTYARFLTAIKEVCGKKRGHRGDKTALLINISCTAVA